MSRNWDADSYHRKDSVDATLDAMTRTDYDGQFRMERFIGYGELPDILCKAAEEAGRLVLGRKFKAVTRWRNDGPPPRVWISRPRRDVRDQGLGEMSINFNVVAILGWKWYSDIDRHLAAFKTIFNHMKAAVIARYPEAQCYMTHDYSGGYDFNVVLAPSLPYGMAA